PQLLSSCVPRKSPCQVRGERDAVAWARRDVNATAPLSRSVPLERGGTRRSHLGRSMTSKQQHPLQDGAAAFLEPGEQLLATVVAQARGTAQARTTRGALGGAVGSVVGSVFGKPGDADRAAADQDLVIRSPMGMALTDRRLVTLEIDGMSKGNVKGLLSALPI